MARKGRSLRLSVLFFMLILMRGPALAAESPYGWVGLYNEDMIALLEYQNRIEMLCPPSQAPELTEQCRRERLKPRTWTLDVREQPSAASKSTGAIKVTAAPGSGLSFEYAAPGRSVHFTPDLFDVDWGYGPHFHQTFLDRRGSWFKLPGDPLPGPGWIDMNQLNAAPDTRSIEVGQIYLMDGESLLVLAVERGSVTMRPEQPGDLWCQEGEPPKILPFQKRKLLLGELFDRNGHLRLQVKYMRGC